MDKLKSAPTIDLFCLSRKFLVYNLVSRNIKLKYRQSILGFLWTLIIPAFSAVVYWIVFKQIIKIQAEFYLTFILSGVLPWAFLAGSLTSGMESLLANQNLINKVPIPVHVFPFVDSITGFINLVLSIPALLIVARIEGAPLTFQILLLLPFSLILFVQTYALSIILSVAFVYFRDLRHVLGIVLQTWFYATPILYLTKMIPPSYIYILDLNPVSQVFRGFRYALNLEADLSLINVLTMLLWMCVLLLGAVAILKATSENLVEDL